MKMYGEWMSSPTTLNLGTRWTEWAASRTHRFTPEETVDSAPCIRDWVGLSRSGSSGDEKICGQRPELKLDSSIAPSVASSLYWLSYRETTTAHKHDVKYHVQWLLCMYAAVQDTVKRKGTVITSISTVTWRGTDDMKTNFHSFLISTIRFAYSFFTKRTLTQCADVWA
jgi:hypothetical protein